MILCNEILTAAISPTGLSRVLRFKAREHYYIRPISVLRDILQVRKMGRTAGVSLSSHFTAVYPDVEYDECKSRILREPCNVPMLYG